MSTFVNGDPNSTPTDGQTLVYDGAKGAYVPGSPPDGGIYVKRDPSRLNGTLDAADITDFGQYPNAWDDPAVVALMGLPDGAGSGLLEVLKVNEYVILQRYTTNAGNRTWIRASQPGGWLAWVEQMLVSAGQVGGAAGFADTITNPGFHRNGWPASQSATQNLPANAGEGVLEVHELAANFLLQKYTAIMPAGLWVRYYVGGTWSAWQALASAA